MILNKVNKLFVISILLLFVAATLLYSEVSTVEAKNNLQLPTGSVPTVTGTPSGATAVVLANEQGFANVRAGPSTIGYEIIGVLVVGQQVPALGRSSGGDWIQISYPGVPGGIGWIWSDLVDIRGTLSVVEPPPTPTPNVTPTIDPTLAAQFDIEIVPTRLPTYTAPAPVTIPTYEVEEPSTTPAGIPMGLVIIGLTVVGLFGTLISFLGGR
ncbi:MAG: SH3 domain-containing protein [Anaerolineales bacterium]|jgi:hypothetical protein